MGDEPEWARYERDAMWAEVNKARLEPRTLDLPDLHLEREGALPIFRYTATGTTRGPDGHYAYESTGTIEAANRSEARIAVKKYETAQSRAVRHVRVWPAQAHTVRGIHIRPTQ